jgi:hypothetical protein
VCEHSTDQNSARGRCGSENLFAACAEVISKMSNEELEPRMTSYLITQLLLYSE